MTGFTQQEIRFAHFMTAYMNMLAMRCEDENQAVTMAEDTFEWFVDHPQAVMPFVEQPKKMPASPLQLEAIASDPNECVYIIGCGGLPEMFKIGITNKLDKRLNAIATSNPFKPYIVHVFYTDQSRALEAALHAEFAGKRTHGEWFQLSDVDVINAIDMGEHMIAQPQPVAEADA